MNTLTVWKALVRREFQEARSLVIAPVAAAAVVILGMVLVALKSGDVQFRGGNIRIGSVQEMHTAVVFAMASIILIVGGIAISAYLMDSLYTERKDRSILFWKSLPVSDAQTVGSKLLVALGITPLLLLGLGVAVHLFGAVLLTLKPPPGFPAVDIWQPGPLLRGYGLLAASMAVNLLWYAPLAAYALLASVLSRRSPWLMVILPPTIIGVVENMLLGWRGISRFIGERIAPRTDFVDALASPDLWLGLLVAVVGVLAVIRLRRWRDDS